MTRTALLFRNVTSNWVGFAVNAVVTLLLTPYVLHELGVARYGIWILTGTLIGYYGFLDLGFRAGVTQYLTRYLAVQDHEKASDCISTAVVALAALGTTMVFLTVGAAFAAPYFFTFPPEMQHEAFWCILIFGVCTVVQCVLSPFSGIFWALQRFDLSNLIAIVTRLLSAGAIVAALKSGYGLIGVSVAFCGITALDYIVRAYVSRRLAPQLRISWRRANKERLREVCSFGGWYFLQSVNHFVYHYIPSMLIGLFMPIAAVGHYALAFGLSRQINSVLSPIPQVMYPAAAAEHAKNDMHALERLYHQGSRLMMLLMVPAVLGAYFWAEDFYRLWIGPSYLTGDPFPSVVLLFHLLLISTFFLFTSAVTQQILMGAGKVRMVSIAAIIGSIINLGSTLLLIRHYGLVGVALGSLIAVIALDFIAMPLMLQHALGFSVLDFLKQSCFRPLGTGILQAGMMGCVQLAGHPQTVAELAFQGAQAVLGSTAIAALLGLTRDERQRYVVQPIRSFFKKILNSGISGGPGSLLDKKR